MPGASAMVRSNTSRCRSGSRSRSLSGSTTRARSQSLVEERQGRVVPVRAEGAHRVGVAAEVGQASPSHTAGSPAWASVWWKSNTTPRIGGAGGTVGTQGP